MTRLMIFASDSPILVIFCRRPTLGVGKQRIAAELGAQAALKLAEMLLETTLEDARAWPGPVVIAPAAAGDREWAGNLLPAATVIPQPAGNLGDRLNGVDKIIREAGGQQILYIGSDAPGLTPFLLHEAAAALTTADTVFIPARDGGVVLLGAARPWPGLTDLPWETAALGEALQTRCAEHDFTTTRLPTSFDIDLRQDLVDAPQLLCADTRPARTRLVTWIVRSGLVQSSGHQPISIIIPVYNDLAALETLLETTAVMRTAVLEVIVIDGGDSDTCKSLSSLHNCRYIASRPCRGAQLRLGADNARGDIFWFLHADCTPPPNAPGLIANHLADGFAAGYFRFRFEGEHRWYKQFLQWAINLRAAAGTPYGDQGLFCRRDAYTQAGGFAAIPLFEEVKLVRKLRSQARFGRINTSIGVSPRRWERDGWLRRSLHNRGLAIAYMLGIAPERLVRRYNASTESSGS